MVADNRPYGQSKQKLKRKKIDALTASELKKVETAEPFGELVRAILIAECDQRIDGAEYPETNRLWCTIQEKLLALEGTDCSMSFIAILSILLDELLDETEVFGFLEDVCVDGCVVMANRGDLKDKEGD